VEVAVYIFSCHFQFEGRKRWEWKEIIGEEKVKEKGEMKGVTVLAGKQVDDTYVWMYLGH
jgi:hypothetical protein